MCSQHLGFVLQIRESVRHASLEGMTLLTAEGQEVSQ